MRFLKKFEYSDDYAFSLGKEIRRNICEDYSDGIGVRGLIEKYEVSNSMIRRILIHNNIYKYAKK